VFVYYIETPYHISYAVIVQYIRKIVNAYWTAPSTVRASL